MNDKSPKQISRRDAIKILGAVAGASVLANLPGKWNKPELTSGVLPAHAQTSVAPPDPTTPHNLAAGADDPNANFCAASFTSTVTITPATPGIVMRYVIVPTGAVSVTSGLNGTVTTDGSGNASLLIAANPASVAVGNTVTVTWSFENASDGSGSDSQVFTSTAACGGGHTLEAGADDSKANFCVAFTSTVKITPNTREIPMRYVITTNGAVSVTSPALNGTVTTGAGGVASLLITTNPASVAVGNTVTVTWSFENASDGSGSDSQVFTSAAVCGHTLVAGDDADASFCQNLISTATITPHASDIILNYIITTKGTVSVTSPALNGTATTVAGEVSLLIIIKGGNGAFAVGDTVTVTWSFANSSDGSGSDAQVFTNTSGGC